MVVVLFTEQERWSRDWSLSSCVILLPVSELFLCSKQSNLTNWCLEVLEAEEVHMVEGVDVEWRQVG